MIRVRVRELRCLEHPEQEAHAQQEQEGQRRGGGQAQGQRGGGREERPA